MNRSPKTEPELTDPRVTYWEPTKWAARLRHHNTGETHILSWINMEAGHGGASGRFDRLKEVVPIWKQEHWDDGVSQWLHPGTGQPRAEAEGSA